MIIETTAENSPSKIKVIIGGTIGNLAEWYNFLLYGYLASVISQLFFPLKNQLLSLTLSFTVFALSFFARPFGGILFGWIGDTYGRQRALVISLILMAIPTLLIGCLPTYNSIGIISPMLLCFFRICQGLSTGGEHTGSAVYIAEYAPPNRRGLWVTTVPASASVGILISSLVSLLIISSFTEAELIAGGWRVGYFIGAVLCLISIALRLKLPETPYFKNMQKAPRHKRYPLSSLLNNIETIKSLLIVIGLASSWGIFYQILFIWMPTYLTQILHFSHDLALQINSVFISCFAGLILVVGYYLDQFKRKTMLTISCVAMAVLAYPLFIMLSSGALLQVLFAMVVFTLFFSLYLPTAFVTMVEAFNPDIRFTGLSLGFNIGLALFGGTCPLIATWLIETTKNNAAPSFYMIFAAVIALFISMLIVEKRGQPI